MLRTSLVRLNPQTSPGSSYRNRMPWLPGVRFNKRRYLPNRNFDKANVPISGLMPEQYKDQHFRLRHGVDWNRRVNKRDIFRNWPWVTIHDDPVGDKLARENRGHRTLRVSDQRKAMPPPRYDIYAEAGLDLRVSADVPLSVLTPFVYPHVAQHFTLDECNAMMAELEKRYPTPGAVHAAGDQVLASTKFEPSGVALGFAGHVRQLSDYVVQYAQRRKFRELRHAAGELRTNEMERYYAMPPRVEGPAVPVKLAQPAGKPRLPYSEMNFISDEFRAKGTSALDAAFRIDRRTTKNKMPA